MDIGIAQGKKRIILTGLMAFSFLFPIIIGFITNPSNSKNSSIVSTIKLSGTFTSGNQYQGSGNSLIGISTANSYSSQTAVSITNTTSMNVPLSIDQAHGWKGTKVNATITNIKDTRDWVRGGSYNNTNLNFLNSTATRVYDNLWYPNNGTYYRNMAFASTMQVYANNFSRAIQIHFKYIHIALTDTLYITDIDGYVLQSLSGSYSSGFTSYWLNVSQIIIGYVSTNSNNKLSDAYQVDYINYVPVNATIATTVESAHPYPNSLSGTTGNVLNSVNPSLSYMRVHFTRMELEGDVHDYLRLYNNASSNFNSFGTSTGNDIEIDRWSAWTISNRISFNLTTNSTGQMWGYKVDQYQLSALSTTAQYAANSKRLNINIYWNHYINNHALGLDNLTLSAPGANFMRINFTYINFEKDYDYLVLYDNVSRFLMDYNGAFSNILTPWFPTNLITITYISDSTGIGTYTGIQKLNLGAKINYYEWTSYANVKLDSRKNGWTFANSYDTTPGRGLGYGAIRGGNLGLAVQLNGINQTTSGVKGYQKFEYEKTDSASFYQIVPVPRGKIIDGYLSINYWADKLMDSNDFNLFFAINDTIVYSKGFTTMNILERQWQSSGNIWMPLWTNTSSLFATFGSSSYLKISAGIRYASPASVSYTWFRNVDRQIVVLDNIKLVLVTAANATQPDINLRINGTALTNLGGAGWGRAQFIAIGSWAYNPLKLSFTTAAPSVMFDTSYTLDLQTSPNSTRSQTFNDWGTTFSVSSGANVNWVSYENVYIPSGYQNYLLNVSKPRSWSIDSVMDPVGNIILFQGGTTANLYFSFITTTTGWFRVNAHSSNALGSIELSTDNATWNPSLTANNKQKWYVQAPFSPALQSLSGNTSIFVRAPNSTTWYQNGKLITSKTGLTFGPLTFGNQNTTGGAYSGLIAWENGTGAGLSSFSVINIHSSRVQVIFPLDARSTNSTSQSAGSVIPIRVLFNDTFSNTLISGATISGSLNSSPAINFNLVESGQGIYDYSLDASTIPEGIYNLTITATKAGYVIGSLVLIIHINVDTRIDNFSSYQEVESGFNTTIIFHYHDINRNIGVTGATLLISGLSGISYSTIAYPNGNYSVVVNSTGFTLGSHAYTITVQKPYHIAQVMIGSINVMARKSQLDVLNGTLSGYLMDPVGPFTLNFYHPVYPSIKYSRSIFTIFLDSGLKTILNPAYYTLTNTGNGFSTVTIFTGPTTPFITPGFKQLFIVGRNSSASQAYVSNSTAALSLNVNTRTLHYALLANGTTWDGISEISGQLDQHVKLEFQFTDDLKGTPVLASTINETLPLTLTAVISSVTGASLLNIFNNSVLGIGRHVLNFVFTATIYSTVTVNILVEVMPKILQISITSNRTHVQAIPRDSIMVSISLADERGHPKTGVNVSYSWAGGLGFFTDMQNGTYEATILMPNSEGFFNIVISAYLNDNYTTPRSTIYVTVQKAQLSAQEQLTNIIVVGVIIAVFFILIFVLYLRPRIIKRKLTRFEDVKTCTVHKGPIKEGLSYSCPTCGSIYCTKCAQALFNNNEACWLCATPIQPFAISYEQDWRSNLQYFFIYLNGNPEQVFQQSMIKDDVLVTDSLKYLQKSIGRNIITINNKKVQSDVQEYFNSKIIFYRGNIVTVVVVSKIESSFIQEKLKGFVEEFEEIFFDKTKHWKEGAHDKFSTNIQTLIEKMFIQEQQEEKPAQALKGKKKGSKDGGYVNAADEIHRVKNLDKKEKYAPPTYKPLETKDTTPSFQELPPEEKITIPVAMPESKSAPQIIAASDEDLTKLDDSRRSDPEIKAAMAALSEIFEPDSRVDIFLPPEPSTRDVKSPRKEKQKDTKETDDDTKDNMDVGQ